MDPISGMSLHTSQGLSNSGVEGEGDEAEEEEEDEEEEEGSK